MLSLSTKPSLRRMTRVGELLSLLGVALLHLSIVGCNSIEEGADVAPWMAAGIAGGGGLVGGGFTTRVYMHPHTVAAAAAASSAPLSSRARKLAAAAGSSGGNVLYNISSPFANFGRMYTIVSLGTPPVSFVVNVDTSTSLSWVSCDCLQCPTSSTIVEPLMQFSSSSSSSSSPVPCSSPTCAMAPLFGCKQLARGGRQGVCEYSLSTNGTLLKDKMAVTAADGTATTADVVFGCASIRPSEDLSDVVAVDGVLGLGAREYSVLAQLKQAKHVSARAFALCFDTTSNAGFLSLGAPMAPPNLTVTRMNVFDNDTRYFLQLTQLRVGGTPVAGSAGLSALQDNFNGGFTVKTGYLSSGLKPDVHKALVGQVFSDKSLRRSDVDIYSCVHLTVFELQDVVFPSIFLDFKEGAMEITPNNYLIKYGEDNTGMILCLSAIPIEDDPTNGFIGSLWLRDTYLRFDLDRKELQFTPINCSSGDYFLSVPSPSPTLSPAATPAPSPASLGAGNGSSSSSLPPSDAEGSPSTAANPAVALQTNDSRIESEALAAIFGSPACHAHLWSLWAHLLSILLLLLLVRN